MAKRRKPTSPVDRVLADVDRQIETVERQLRAMGHDLQVRQQPNASPGASIKQFVKEILTPPDPRPAGATANARQDLFDIQTNPVEDISTEAIAFPPARDPDLFAQARVATTRPAAPAINAGEKLVQYLAAGSVRAPKPILKRVQRETRNRFFVWLGLSFVALWLIYAVVR